MDDRELLRLLERDPESGIRQLTQQYAGLVFSVIAGRAGSTASPITSMRPMFSFLM